MSGDGDGEKKRRAFARTEVAHHRRSDQAVRGDYSDLCTTFRDGLLAFAVTSAETWWETEMWIDGEKRSAKARICVSPRARDAEIVDCKEVRMAKKGGDK